MLEWITQVMNSLGYAGVMLLMALENIVPPIPSEFIMPAAGYASTQGKLSFVGVVVAGGVGSAFGALPLYWLGKYVGEKRLEAWADKYGKWLAVSREDLQKAQAWFDKHGGKSVFICCLVPGVRSLISIPAGVARMRVVPFLLYELAGMTIWAGLLAYLGRLLGKNYTKVNQYLGPAAYVVLSLLAVAVIVHIVRHKKQSAVGSSPRGTN